MRYVSKKNKADSNISESGFSLTELIVVVASLAIIATIALPMLATRKCTSVRIKCVNNLKNVGLALRIFATDNNDLFPAQVIATNRANLLSIKAVDVFRFLSNELSTTKILQCPQDQSRMNHQNLQTGFSQLASKDLSYFASLNVSEEMPQDFLAGDRNLLANGKPAVGLLALSSNLALTVSWSKEIHIEQGNIALGDGSVQSMGTGWLRQAVAHQELGTNYLSIP